MIAKDLLDLNDIGFVSAVDLPRVGIIYEGWHAHAYFGRGDTGLTPEAF